MIEVETFTATGARFFWTTLIVHGPVKMLMDPAMPDSYFIDAHGFMVLPGGRVEISWATL